MERIVLPEIKNLHDIDVYLANKGFEAAKKLLLNQPMKLSIRLKSRV